LLEEGNEVAAVTRNPAAAALSGGARLFGGDPSRPKTLTAALPDVEAIFLVPRAVGGASAELLSLAAAHGVQRVVVLSAVTVQYSAGHRRFADEFEAVEDAAKASGLSWTILRSADFDANALMWAPQIRSMGVVCGAYGDATTSPIHERDIAAVGVETLVNAAHAGRCYVLTGPQSLSQRARVRLIGDAIGEKLSWEEISPDQLRAAMLAQSMPEDVPDRLLGSLADYAQRPGPTSTDVEQILGRRALTFAEWAADHRAAFRN
jgi:uncharacterized protein YbjT (DUF2867 family)